MNESVIEDAIKILKVSKNPNEEANIFELYDKFNNEKNSSGTSTICERKEHESKIDDNIYQLCRKIENIVRNWTQIMNGYKTNNYKHCNYLIYWLYDKVVKEGNSNSFNINWIYGKFQNLLEKNSFCAIRNEKCNRIFDKVFNVNTLKNKKYFYDISESYNFLKDILNGDNSDNQKKCCDYIKYIFGLYKEINEKPLKSAQGCFDEINYFETTYKKKDILDLITNKCHISEIESIFTKNNEALSISNAQPESELDQVYALPIIAEKLDESILNDLPSQEIYKELNSNQDLDKYKDYCEQLFETENNKDSLLLLCKKFSRNLKGKLSNIENKETNNTDRCLYFNHWLYEEIGKIYADHSKYVYNIPAFSKFLSVSDTINSKLMPNEVYKNIQLIEDELKKYYTDLLEHLSKQIKLKKEVNYPIYEAMPKENFKHYKITNYVPCVYNLICRLDECKYIKDLFDYFKNYKTISKCDISSEKVKCQNYCKYVTYINKLYENYIHKCCTYFSTGKHVDNCPKHFKCDQEYNPYKLYLKLNCSEIQQQGEKLIEVIKPSPIDQYVKWLTDISEKQRHISHNLYSSKILYEMLISDPFYMFTLTFSGIIGIFFLFFILYKFTPLRSIFDKGEYQKKSIKNNLIEDNKIKHATHNKESKRKNPPNQRIRIAYDVM
ncbi:PIR protein [Plasmodium vivax]|uniref:VIR protein n=1 Tax=Plasmodium vivax TaxID=5855 RepID=A0A565A3G2_PLAVI|nr:PIR protein [Plasmodium vivax]